MFGIFYLLFNTAITGIAKFKQDVEYDEARNNAKQKNDLTYYGDNGERLVSNNRSVYRKVVNGDKVLADLYTGEIYKNYTAENKQKRKIEANSQNKTVVCCTYDDIQEYNKKERHLAKCFNIKPEYRDIKTDKFYITITLNGLRFYMDIITGEVVRMVDEQDISNKWGDLSVDDIINIINNRQKELRKLPKESHDFMWWEKNFYLKYYGLNILFIDNDKNIIIGNYIKDKEINKKWKLLRGDKNE